MCALDISKPDCRSPVPTAARRPEMRTSKLVLNVEEYMRASVLYASLCLGHIASLRTNHRRCEPYGLIS